MKVIVCGAGQVGWQIARHLSGEGNDVTIIDIRPDLVRRATEALDVQGVAGFASHPDVLDAAGAQDAEMIIAATRSDEVNMVCCQIARVAFDIPRKIARIRSRTYLGAESQGVYDREQLGIDAIISPEREVAEAALQRLAAPATFDSEAFMGGRAQLLGVQLAEDCPVLNTPLRQLNDLFPTLRAIVVGVRRNERLFAPDPGDQLLAGDRIYIFSHAEDIDRCLEIFGKRAGHQGRIVIIGGGSVGLAVARALETRRKRMHVRIIEKDRAVAEHAAEELERTIVLNGDGLDLALLQEAGIERSDAVLTLTNDDRTNLLAAVRAKESGCPFAIALVNDPALSPLITPLDIDAAIDPRATTVSSILRYLRRGRVHEVYSIGDAEAEVLEARVLTTSPLAGKTIREVPFPNGALVGAIMKGERVVKPDATTRLDVGDTIAIFSISGDVPEVERLLQVSVDFF